MTPEQQKTLKNMITEYGNSLTRIQAERELMKTMETRAIVELHCYPKAFKTVATAYWLDDVKKSRETLEALVDMFDYVRGCEAVELREVDV
jgi:hypothetical protein